MVFFSCFFLPPPSLDCLCALLARYERLSVLKVPTTWTNQIDLDVMTLNSKPYSDREELLPVCFRCGTTNPLLNNNSGGAEGGSNDRCVACGHPFVRSFVSFDQLPLVLFTPEPGISDAEACQLIMQAPKHSAIGGSSGRGDEGWNERETGGDGGPDSFTAQLMNFDGGPDTHARRPIRADAKTLLGLKVRERPWRGLTGRQRAAVAAFCRRCRRFSLSRALPLLCALPSLKRYLASSSSCVSSPHSSSATRYLSCDTPSRAAVPLFTAT